MSVVGPTKLGARVIGSDNATPHVMHADACGVEQQEKLICAMPAEITHFYNSWSNAHFIAEAFNVLHETGMTPRQLVEQRDDLLAALNLARALLVKSGEQYEYLLESEHDRASHAMEAPSMENVTESIIAMADKAIASAKGGAK